MPVTLIGNLTLIAALRVSYKQIIAYSLDYSATWIQAWSKEKLVCLCDCLPVSMQNLRISTSQKVEQVIKLLSTGYEQDQTHTSHSSAGCMAHVFSTNYP